MKHPEWTPSQYRNAIASGPTLPILDVRLPIEAPPNAKGPVGDGGPDPTAFGTDSVTQFGILIARYGDDPIVRIVKRRV